jgi:predicted methyltransferase
MVRSCVIGLALAFVSVLPLAAQQRASSQELKQAPIEAPLLAEVLELKPGMIVGDVGAGFGAMTVVLSEWLGPSGHVYATDITPHALAALKAEVSERKLNNVTVIEGRVASTNLPDACCDAIFLRDVYHHIGTLRPSTAACVVLLNRLDASPLSILFPSQDLPCRQASRQIVEDMAFCPSL